MPAQFVAVRQQATEASSEGNRRACAFVAVRQQATETSSEGSRRARSVRSCQAASSCCDVRPHPTLRRWLAA